MKKIFYCTTPLYYVNGTPHIGSLYSTVIGDVITKCMKFLGKKTLFLTGTDEHGQKVAEAAALLKKDPQIHCDTMAKAFRQTWDEWNISYDIFFRTSDSSHKKSVQSWIQSLIKSDDVYKGSYKGWYSVASENFVAEKDILEKDASGIPLCPISKKPMQWITEDAYFFRLSKYQNQLLNWYEKNPNWLLPKERLEEVISFVKGGLKDLCISRSKKNLSWGIPFPNDDTHVVYVWADALNNYITGVGYDGENGSKNFYECWPCDLHIMAKEIVIFHAVYWPAFLMAKNLPLPKNQLVHGWILMDNQKMSKSIGNIVTPEELKKKYGIDRSRYFFIRHLAVTHDCSFSWQEFEEHVDAELANNLGNLINRLTGIIKKRASITQTTPFPFSVPIPSMLEPREMRLYELLLQTIDEFIEHIHKYMLHKAYTTVWNFITAVNSYFQEKEPWKMKKKEEIDTVIFAVASSLHAIASMIYPVMEESAQKIGTILGVNKLLSADECIYPWGEKFTIQENNQPLFTRIMNNELTENQDIKIEENKKNPSKKDNDNVPTISFDHFMQTKLVVGEIIEVEEIIKSDKLYKLTVDFGIFGKKTICSGIKKFFSKESLLCKKTVFVYNLEPRKICNIESQGMLLTTETDNVITLLSVTANISNGTILK